MLNPTSALRIGILTGLLITLCAKASDFQSPRTIGLGGAGHASPLFTDAIYLNPSYIPMLPVYALSLNYLWFDAGQIATSPGTTDNYRHDLNFSFQNGNREAPVQFGAGYTLRESYSLIHLAAAKSFGDGKFSVGLGSKVILPDDPSAAKTLDGSLSFSAILSEGFRASLIFDNLFNAAQDRGFVSEYILGTKWSIASFFQLYLDPHLYPTLSSDPSHWGYEMGAELPFLENFSFRMGGFNNSMISYQTQRGDGFGLGLGWLTPLFSFDIGLSKTTQPISAFAESLQITFCF